MGQQLVHVIAPCFSGINIVRAATAIKLIITVRNIDDINTLVCPRNNSTRHHASGVSSTTTPTWLNQQPVAAETRRQRKLSMRLIAISRLLSRFQRISIFIWYIPEVVSWHRISHGHIMPGFGIVSAHSSLKMLILELYVERIKDCIIISYMEHNHGDD